MNLSEQLALKRQLTIDYWARYSIADLQKSIRQKNIGRTHALISSLSYTRNETAVDIKFIGYGKLLDMGVGRGRTIGDLAYNRLVYSAISQKNKNNKWMSRSLYKNIASLSKIIQEKYNEDSVAVVLETLNNLNLTLNGKK